jgi:hypothetical protein
MCLRLILTAELGESGIYFAVLTATGENPEWKSNHFQQKENDLWQ